MRKNRYQPPDADDPGRDHLPLDTDCTILVRQSARAMQERNMDSAELHPDELVGIARDYWGFAPERIQVIDWDMGIGAYSTTIDMRPGLRHWLNDLLPGGKSRVVLVSQEDRLFRDRDEIDHNVFIKQVAQHGGWVICGHSVYNFQLDRDKENFRDACKYGKQYIERHVKRRLHPAIQRAAMAGRYAGGPVPWGYVVDYAPQSSTYKHFVPYEPHARLVAEQVFGYFAHLPIPSVVEVARHWAQEGLIWPFFSPDVDARRLRLVERTCTRDELRGGYQFHTQQVPLILTNVAYLGWRARNGQVARDDEGRPRVCHQPLVDESLFWWCYDHLMKERPPWYTGAVRSTVVSPSS